jgi:hypothetical protein
VCLELVPELLEGGTGIFTVLLTGDASDLLEVDLVQMSAYDTVNAFHDHTTMRRRIQSHSQTWEERAASM